MKYLLIILLSINIYASIKTEMLELYKKKEYKQVCKKGFDNFQTYKKDEQFVSIYAFGCLNADYIDRLTVPIAALKYSEEARANATYFSVILMQKKMLYHALADGYKINNLKLPSTDYILSKVFDMYAQLKETNQKFYIFKDKNHKNIMYKLYILKDGQRVPKMVIEKYNNSKLIKQHTYW